MAAFGAVCWSVRMDLSEIKRSKLLVQASLQNDFFIIQDLWCFHTVSQLQC